MHSCKLAMRVVLKMIWFLEISSDQYADQVYSIMTFYLILHSGWKIFKSPDLLLCFVRLFGWFEIPVFLSNLIPTEKSAGIWNYPKNRSDPSCSNIFCALRNTNSLRISIHLKALSFRVFGLVHEYLRIPDPQSPIPNLRSTILDARCPIPDPRSPIPDPYSF